MVASSGLARASWSAHFVCVVLLGLMAGFFATYSGNVNLAMLEFDGATYAAVQSAFNRNVRHLGFFACFFGPVPVGALALACAWRDRHKAWWRLLLLVVLAYALGIVMFTRQVNLPLNYLTESWTPETLPKDWHAVRDAWNRANAWRSALTFVLFVTSLFALTKRSGATPGNEKAVA